MTLFSNDMWNNEEMSPTRRAVPNPKTTTDSFVGAPLAVGAHSPPAGPVSDSIQMAGAMEGYREATTLGKGLVIGSALLTSFLTFPRKNGTVLGYTKSVAVGGTTFYLMATLFDKVRRS